MTGRLFVAVLTALLLFAGALSLASETAEEPRPIAPEPIAVNEEDPELLAMLELLELLELLQDMDMIHAMEAKP